jgi:hypothetical protein
MKIDVRSNIDEVLGWLSDIQQKQLPFATVLALNNTAIIIRKDAAAALKENGSAKPFTTSENAFFITRANKSNLVVEIGYKDIQARYMKWQLGGGKRTATGFEVKLRSMGILPMGYVTVPAAIQLDSYGNIPKAVLTTIIGQLTTSLRVFKGKGKRAHADALFVVLPGDRVAGRLHPGIWQRIERGNASNIKPLIFFVTAANYRATKFFDFQGVGQKTYEREFPGQMTAALAEAVSTAR